MERENKTKRNLPAALGKVLLAMYIITGILLVILAALLYKLELSEAVVNIAIIVIYVLVGFLGGFLIGRIQGSRKYMWGALMGLGYFAVQLIVSLVIHKGLDAGIQHMLTTLVLCTASGAIGGMVS